MAKKNKNFEILQDVFKDIKDPVDLSATNPPENPKLEVASENVQGAELSGEKKIENSSLTNLPDKNSGEKINQANESKRKPAKGANLDSGEQSVITGLLKPDVIDRVYEGIDIGSHVLYVDSKTNNRIALLQRACNIQSKKVLVGKILDLFWSKYGAEAKKLEQEIRRDLEKFID